MGEIVQLFDCEDVNVARRQLMRWEGLVKEVGIKTLGKFSREHRLTPKLASIIGRILLRLGQDGNGYVAIDQLEDESYGASTSSVRRAVKIGEALGFISITQKRRGATLRVKFYESRFDSLEIKARYELHLVRITERRRATNSGVRKSLLGA